MDDLYDLHVPSTKHLDHSPKDIYQNVSQKEHIWRYINFLYGIELLRNSNIENIDMQISWQYGQEYNTPWKDNNILVYRFLNDHRDLLRAFIIKKYNNLLNKLIAEVDNFKSGYYLSVSLTPSLLQSISAAMQNIQTDDNLLRSFRSESLLSTSLNSAATSTIRHCRGIFTSIELADRALQSWFDLYPESNYELQHQHQLGPYRNEIFDDRIYSCICWMKKQMNTAIAVNYTPDTHVNIFKLYDGFYSLFASLLSIMYHTVVPIGMHPNRLDRLYTKYFTTDDAYIKYLAKVRMCSGLTVEDVADSTLPMINYEYFSDTVLKDFTKRKMVKFLLNATYPDSLVEKYLMTQYFVQKECNYSNI